MSEENKGNMINIGSKERPILVPEKALRSESSEGRRWWGMVVEGCVVLRPEALDRLLEKTDDKKS